QPLSLYARQKYGRTGVVIMRNHVLSLDQIHAQDRQRVGNKAMNLSRLARSGFPVPHGLCVTTEAFWPAFANKRYRVERILGKFDLRDPEQAQIASQNLGEILDNLSVSLPIMTALGSLIASQVPLAVRSSSTAEDEKSASYAGIYATFLGVRGSDAVQKAIIDCWRSYFEPQALIARAARGRLGQEHGMAVLIQPMLYTECSGLCFSVDPV